MIEIVISYNIFWHCLCSLHLNKMAQTIYLSFFAGLLLYFSCNVYGNEIMFSNTWAVKIRGGDFTLLEKLALKHGFVNETQVRSRILLRIRLYLDVIHVNESWIDSAHWQKNVSALM